MGHVVLRREDGPMTDMARGWLVAWLIPGPESAAAVWP